MAPRPCQSPRSRTDGKPRIAAHLGCKLSSNCKKTVVSSTVQIVYHTEESLSALLTVLYGRVLSAICRNRASRLKADQIVTVVNYNIGTCITTEDVVLKFQRKNKAKTPEVVTYLESLTIEGSRCVYVFELTSCTLARSVLHQLVPETVIIVKAVDFIKRQ